MNSKKKAGLITAGVVTALVAASPLAFAGDWGGDHGHGHHGKPGQECTDNGGDALAGQQVGGGLLANVGIQAPVAGNQIANIGNCSNFLNNNLNDNVNGNAIGVLSGPVVAP